MSPATELDQAVASIRAHFKASPDVGVVLGSGLGAFAETLVDRVVLEMASLPHFPAPNVAGHAGRVCLGRIGNAQIACLSGRVHAYEGQALDRVVFGVRVLSRLGCRAVLLTNAAGGIRGDLAPGDLMLISDHLNLTAKNPLVGPNHGSGPRFPDMSEAYDGQLRALAHHAAEQLNLDVKEGVYAGVLGPSYETPAEVRMLRALGADAVGMSTVLEVIALRHLGVRVAAVSAITNRAAGLSRAPLDHAEVQATAQRVERVFVEFLGRWATLVALSLSSGP
jgi:purine-nucleoside phosphorylase